MKIKKISVIGLGKLGLPFAACLADRGFKVIGFDKDRAKSNKLKAGKLFFYEPHLAKLLRKTRNSLSITDDCKKSVFDSEVTFIVVPTPSDKNGNFSVRYILDTCKAIGPAIRKKRNFHLVVIISTVTPGSIENKIKPTLESYSGKKCGRDFGLCYNPEFIALGNVIHDLYNPNFVLIGESDRRSGNVLTSLYARFCKNKAPAARMNFINAELTKLLVNTFVTMKISYANMIARLCELLPQANVDTVTKALGLDERIGSKYLKGALGYGGPCFPRDNLALIYTAKKANAKARLAEATHATNMVQVRLLRDNVISNLPRKGSVGILGLAYKPDTDVVEKAQGVMLARMLAKKGIRVVCYDPVAGKNARRLLNGRVKLAPSVKECVKRASVIVVATPWDEFRNMPLSCFKKTKRQPVLIDCWRIVNSKRLKGLVKYTPLGMGPGSAC